MRIQKTYVTRDITLVRLASPPSSHNLKSIKIMRFIEKKFTWRFARFKI